jgi:hypothetical protein
MIAALLDVTVACRVSWWMCPQMTGAPRVTAIAAAMALPDQAARVRAVLMVSPH